MKIGIIGLGNMGSGIAPRISKEHEVFLFDRDENWTKELAQTIKAKPCKNEAELVNSSEFIILAVKPQNLLNIAKQLKGLIKKQLLISLLAGTPMSSLKQHFGHIPILRIMPNLAAIFGSGVIGLVDNHELPTKTKKNIEKVFQVLGSCHWMPEDKIDALTSLTASGPAFACVIIESMIDAAIYMGFDSKTATDFVLQTLTGTITMLKETGKHPAELKWQVTSPGGTTSAGLKKLEEEGLRGIIIDTYVAALQRAQQMSHEH